jgi:hypothetical protein
MLHVRAAEFSNAGLVLRACGGSAALLPRRRLSDAGQGIEQQDIPGDGPNALSMNAAKSRFALTVKRKRRKVSFVLARRRRNAAVKADGENTDISSLAEKGSLKLNHPWKNGGTVAYCREEIDNSYKPADLVLAEDPDFTDKYEKALHEGVIVIGGRAHRRETTVWGSELFKDMDFTKTPGAIEAVCRIYAWNDRGVGEMREWNSTLLIIPPEFSNPTTKDITLTMSPNFDDETDFRTLDLIRFGDPHAFTTGLKPGFHRITRMLVRWAKSGQIVFQYDVNVPFTRKEGAATLLPLRFSAAVRDESVYFATANPIATDIAGIEQDLRENYKNMEQWQLISGQ